MAAVTATGIGELATMRTALALLLVAHGLIHLLGFTKAFAPAKVESIHSSISPLLGLLWLLAAILLTASAALLIGGARWWPVASLLALIVSQLVIATAWRDARFGTLANLVVLVPTCIALLSFAPSSFASIYRREVDRGLRRASSARIVTEEDLALVPPPVQRYLRYSGAVGHPRVRSVHARFRGEMRPAPDAGWMRISAEQYNFFDEPERVFLMGASRLGVPFEALHLYVGPSATMRVKLASLVPVVDAKGPEMNRGETVTMFNDMCVLAPATLLDERIRWIEIDAHDVKATFTNAGNTISAVLSFGDDGALASFASDDRYESADGKKFCSYRWTTPLRDYRDYHGHKLASHGEASWRHPEGEFVYARFDVVDVEYDGAANHDQ